MPSFLAYVVVGGAAALVTFVCVPIMIRLAPRLGTMVPPSERHVHASPTPTAGGAAMILGVIVAVAVAAVHPEFSEVMEARTEMVGVVVAACVMWSVGFVDDLREISAPAKIAGMVLSGSILSLTGVSILVFRVPFFDLLVLSADWSFFVTVVWVVSIANIVNLVDGLDGLAAGIVAIAAGTFLLYALRLGDEAVLDPANPGGLWAVIALGLCLGFLPHNVYPARIFMGDGGALLLGLLMAASTMSVGGRTSAEFSGQAFFFFAPIFIPLVILGIPVLDTLWAILRRTMSHQRLSTADKKHLHHRLMNLGHGHQRAVLILWAWTALLSAMVLYPTYTGDGDGIVPIGILALALGLFSVLHPRLRPVTLPPSEETVVADE